MARETQGKTTGMSINRREAIKLGGAAVVATAVPALPVAAVAEPPLLAFVVGTPGEHDGLFVLARTAQEAFSEWRAERIGHTDGEACAICENLPCDCDINHYATRVKRWDGLKGEPTGGDWIDAGFGYICDRCNYEIGGSCDGHNVDGLAICEHCMTLDDYRKTDPETYAEMVEEIMTAEYGPDLRYPQWW
jgi:hypothetical protein